MKIFTSKIWLVSLALIHVIAGLPPLILFGITSTVLYKGFWSQILSLNSQYQGVTFLTLSLVCGTVDLSTLGAQIFLLLAITALVAFLFIGIVLQLYIIYKLPKLIKKPSKNFLKTQKRFMVALLLQVYGKSFSFLKIFLDNSFNRLPNMSKYSYGDFHSV